MKTKKLVKILSVLIAVMLLIPDSIVFAAWGAQESNPYSFGVPGRPIEDVQRAEYGKPSQMHSIVPGRPVKAHDKDGNTLYFTPSGKMTLRITKDGKRAYSLKAQSKIFNADGELEKETEMIKGTNKRVVKKDGMIVQSEELGFGGKTVALSDLTIKDKAGNILSAEKAKRAMAKASPELLKEALFKGSMNKYNNEDGSGFLYESEDGFVYEFNETQSYDYDKYAKSAEYVIDELTKTKTVFNQKGKPSCDINAEGTEIAWYEYDEDDNLKFKKDIKGNVTSFDKDGNMLYTKDSNDNTLVSYNYKEDENGYKTLDTSVDQHGNITYFDNGNPSVQTTAEGDVITEYVYDNNVLIYSFDKTKEEVTWYDFNKKPLFVASNEFLSKEWIYSRGKLVGVWDNSSNRLTAIIEGQEVARYIVSEKPTAEIIQSLIDSGEIKKEYIDENGEIIEDSNDNI